MTVKPPEQPPPALGLDWSPFAQQIVEDAQAALNFPLILLARFDLSARTSQPVSFGGLTLKDTGRANRLGRRLVPGYDVRMSLPIDRNPLLQALCDRGETVTASV